MAGILNNKTRVIDAIITLDGRRQMANGSLQFSFVSFSDDGLFYSSDDGTTINPPHNQLCFEATSLPRDVIIPETDDEGVFSLNLSDSSTIVNGRVIVSGSNTFTTGTINAYSGSSAIMATAIQHFDWQQIIGTSNNDDESKKVFKIANPDVGLTTNFYNKPSIDTIKPILFDDNLSHMKNLKYLPPEYVENEQTYPLGNYPKITSEDHTTYDTFLISELLPSLSNSDVDFAETSDSNNLIGQCFEISPGAIKKLTIIDYGQFEENGEMLGRVFYLGKVARDKLGTPKFLRLFTLVFK